MAPFKSRASTSRRMSPTSELLPEPETPVTQTNSPSGNAASMVLRLLCRAPLIVRNRPSGTLRCSGIAIAFLPARYAPVKLCDERARSPIVPWATTSPPLTPGPGPKSTRWSAARIVSSSCSTTTTVLPNWASRRKVASNRSLSRGCRPIDGSSRMYSTPTSPAPTWLARRIRCASPPESVGAARSRAR